MILKVPLFLWLMLSPLGKADMIRGSVQHYFSTHEHCGKVHYEVREYTDEVEIRIKCIWRKAKCGGK